ncbi:expressed unknown protein [Seminavis robusta]|uniref:Uncharacterized protein n=1 Tax=Seminavis robusta TaxID=568900 RepID=A0A9N8DUU2_9STRA|nr:expressed unknown protein [Seminavis robusta]|eukprot:Sro388_g132390.1 n/a (367) ;mRNA; r:45866-47246
MRSIRSNSGSRRNINSKLRGVQWVFYVVLLFVLVAFAAIPAFIFYDAAMEELHYTDFSNYPTKRLLLVGWTTSLKELSQNWIVNKELEEICRVYDPTRPRSHGYHEGHEGGVRVHIFYQQGDTEAMHELQAVLVQQGCSASFTQENTKINIYTERSNQRQLLLNDFVRYNAVINIDFDNVISLPSLSSLQHGIDHAIDNPASVICANERRTWHILFRQARPQRRQEEDEDEDQQQQPHTNTDFCSEGFTMYSWHAWSNPDCSYFDANNDIGPKGPPVHTVFQACLKSTCRATRIGVQPDLIIWRKSNTIPCILIVVVALLTGLALSLGRRRLSSTSCKSSDVVVDLEGQSSRQQWRGFTRYHRVKQ